MATIQKRTEKSGKVRYVVRWSPTPYNQKSKSFPRLEDARSWKREVERAALLGYDSPDPEALRVPFSEVAERWYESKRKVKRSTLATYRSHLDNAVLPTFGSVPVASIRRADVEQWLTQLLRDEGNSASTARAKVKVLGAVMRRAVSDGLAKSDPTAAVELPRADRKPPMFLTREQVGQLADELDEPDSTIVWLLAGTGLRIGEAAALTWRDIDFDKGALTVNRTASDVNGRLEYTPPKTAAARRNVSLPASTVELLEVHEANCAHTGFDDFVFVGAQGAGIRPKLWQRRKFTPAAKAAGVEGATPHDLRHTHVAWLIDQGVHIKVIQARLGHASIKVTMDTYGHLLAGVDGTAAAAIDDVLSA